MTPEMIYKIIMLMVTIVIAIGVCTAFYAYADLLTCTKIKLLRYRILKMIIKSAGLIAALLIMNMYFKLI